MNRSRTTHHPISLPTGKPYNLGPNNTNKHTHIYIYIYIFHIKINRRRHYQLAITSTFGLEIETA